MGPGLSGNGVCFFGQVGVGGCFVSLHSTSPHQYIFALRYFSLLQFSDILLYFAIESLWTKEIKTCGNKKKKSTNWSGESNCQPVWLLFPKVSLLCKQTNFKYYNILRICRVDPQSSMSEFRNSQTTSCALTVTALYLDEYQKIWKFWMKEILLQTVILLSWALDNWCDIYCRGESGNHRKQIPVVLVWNNKLMKNICYNDYDKASFVRQNNYICLVELE